MSPSVLIILVVVLGFVTVAGVGFVFAGGDNSKNRTLKRAQAVTGGSVAARGEARRARTNATTTEARRKQIIKSLKDQDRQAKKAQLTLTNKLQQAGLKATPTHFWTASGVLGVVVFVALLVVRGPILVDLGLGIGAGLGLPRWIVGWLGNQRRKKFTGSFSDAMDVIVRGIKSGLPVHDCLKIIGRETPEPLAGEFRSLVENIGMGMTLGQALDRMYERMPTPEVRFFSIVMAVQQKTGGNLAEALGNLSAVLRARKLMREKIKALSSEATASAFIIGSMPPAVILMISVTTPSYMAIMIHDPRGIAMLMGSALVMALGVFVMWRMINFKF